MAPIRSSKATATGLLILVLFNLAATTLAQSYANSTEIEHEDRTCPSGLVNLAYCLALGTVCGLKCEYDSRRCCCKFSGGAVCKAAQCIEDKVLC